MRGIIGIILVMLVVLAAWLVGSATAQEIHPRARVAHLRADFNQAAANRCREQITRYAYPNVWRIPPARVRPITITWLNRVRWMRNQSRLCGRQPAWIIRSLFGPTASAALAVAECESHLDPRALGSAGERGLFQIHPVHRTWLGDRWNQLFSARVNARVAYGMSNGGYDWSAWTCQP